MAIMNHDTGSIKPKLIMAPIICGNMLMPRSIMKMFSNMVEVGADPERLLACIVGGPLSPGVGFIDVQRHVDITAQKTDQ